MRMAHRPYTQLLLLLLVHLAIVSLSAASKCHILFFARAGLQRIPLEGASTAETLVQGDRSPNGNHGGIVVDATRNIVLWAEGHVIYRASLSGPSTRTKILSLERSRHTRTPGAPEPIYGLALVSRTNMAYASIYDNRGGFRIFAFDYLQQSPSLNWKWCGQRTCAVRSTYPTGGELLTLDGAIFLAATAQLARALPEGGVGIRGWNLNGVSTEMWDNPALTSMQGYRRDHPFHGTTSGLIGNEEEKKLFFFQTFMHKVELWATDVDGTAVKKVIELPVSTHTWSRGDDEKSVPSPHVASIGGGRFVFSNATHIMRVDAAQPEEFYTLYTQEQVKGTYMSPINVYCEGVHTGGNPHGRIKDNEL